MGGSALDQREVSFVVASTADRLRIQCGLDRADLGGGQLQSGGSRVVFYVLERSGAWNRHDEVALSQEPRQRELGGSAPLSPGHLAEQFEDTQIPSERLRLEPRERLAEIRRGQLISGRQLAREETSSERAVRDEADSELPADPKDTAFGLPAPEGVLALNGRDRMNSMGGAEGAGVRFGESVALDMVAVPIGPAQRLVLVASPAYVSKTGPIRHPEDLKQRACIGRRFPSGLHYAWEFEKDGEKIAVRVVGPLVLDDDDMMVKAAAGGIGYAYVHESTAKSLLDSGQLARSLDDWCPFIPSFHLYYPSRRHVSTVLRAFIDWCNAYYAGSGATR